MLGQPKSVIGVDLGTSSVKAVELTLEGNTPTLTGFGKVETQPGESPALALRELMQCTTFRSRRASLGVAGQSTVVRYLEMVRMSESELRQAIPFELDNHLPFEAEDVTYDCQPLMRAPVSAAPGSKSDASGRDTMAVLLAACRKDLIEERLAVTNAEGLTPVGVNLELFALANAFELAGPAPQGSSDELEAERADGASGELAIALVDVGATRTSINVLAGGETCFSREIHVGGMDLTGAIARRTGLSTAEAEAYKRAAIEGDSDLDTAVLPVIEDLAAELSLSIDYVEHHAGVHVNELLLSGGGLMAAGAVGHLERAVARPARLWSPVDQLQIDTNQVDMEELEQVANSLVIALGLAGKVVTR